MAEYTFELHNCWKCAHVVCKKSHITLVSDAALIIDNRKVFIYGCHMCLSSNIFSLQLHNLDLLLFIADLKKLKCKKDLKVKKSRKELWLQSNILDKKAEEKEKEKHRTFFETLTFDKTIRKQFKTFLTRRSWLPSKAH